MKRQATPSKTCSSSNSRRHRYTKVRDNRKHPIRGLWSRNGKFVARITVEDAAGKKEVTWVPLEAKTDAKAKEELDKLRTERKDNCLRHIGLSPKFEDCARTYLERQTVSKKADTITCETGHLERWIKSIGHIRLDKIRAHHITAHLHALRTAEKAPRTCNLSLVCVRNVLKAAIIDGHLKTNPADGLDWFKTMKPAHRLYSAEEIDQICNAAVNGRFLKSRPAAGEEGIPLKNGVQFRDYLRFLQYSGAREQEALRVQWSHVDTNNGHVMIGAEGDAKNRESRAVDFNEQLRDLLADMATRRAPDSAWLFPSPQRGEADKPAKTFRESLLLVREAAGMPDFGFHDLRRFFASRGVMSGIDFMTVSRWLGHKDGGILLAKTYAHLANEHRKTQAARLIFAPAIIETDNVAGA